MEHLDELERQVFFQQVDDGTGAAVAGVDHDLQGRKCRDVHIGQQVLDVLVHQVELRDLALGSHRREVALLGQLANVLQTRVLTDGTGLLVHELQAVVVGRIVAGGDHDAAVQFIVEGREIHHLGAAATDVQDLHAAVHETPGQGVPDNGTGMADVVTHGHALRAGEGGIGPTDTPGDVLVQFIRHPATGIVSLETADVDLFHDSPSLFALGRWLHAASVVRYQSNNPIQ